MENVTDHDQSESQKRKSSDTGNGVEKKFLRTPTEDSEDNISAQDFQDEIENRFFQKEIEPMVDDEAHAVHQENTVDEAVIIDENRVKRDVPRKRNFMTSAQESSKNFHKKIKAQAGTFKTSLTNKMKKKPKEKPVAVEVADDIEVEHVEQTVEQSVVESPDEPKVEDQAQEVIFDKNILTETETVVETIVLPATEAPAKSKTFKMPNFTKSLKKPSLPTFKKSPAAEKVEKVEEVVVETIEKVQQQPERSEPKPGRFANFRKLGRSKSLKEGSGTTDSTSFTTPETTTAEPTKKRFDFGTYPRLIRDKFKRQKVPERSDQSVRSETPPTIEFAKVSSSFEQRGPVASRWPEYDQESGKYQQFNSESDLDRESSIERRMRLDYERSTEEREDFEIVKRLLNEEQRQLDEMDKENQEIHLMAKQERYKKPVERQESDVTSEEDKLLWSGMLNKDLSRDDFDQPNALRFGDTYKFTLEDADINRSYTPQTNQETQSSGSSGTRRRKGEFDDDDDYFLRENRVSHDIRIGDYISSAIKEGLSTPDNNALVQMGGFEDYHSEVKHELTPEKPTRSLKRKNKKNLEEQPPEKEVAQRENVSSFDDFYKTFPPDRPTRKERYDDDEAVDEIDLSESNQGVGSDMASELIDDMHEQELFYHQQILKGLEHPDLSMDKDSSYDHDIDLNPSKLPVPPTPPRRRKKKLRSPQPVINLRNGDGKTALGEHNVSLINITISQSLIRALLSDNCATI